jgi:hypothetical protein
MVLMQKVSVKRNVRPPPMIILQSGVGAWYRSLYRVDMSEQVQANADP